MHIADDKTIAKVLDDFFNDGGRDSAYNDYEILDGWYSINKLVEILQKKFLVVDKLEGIKGIDR